MFPSSTYQLLDFGGGRRLERFGPVVIDRPCPAAEGAGRADPAAWRQADARFERTGPTEGQWISARQLPERWTIAHGPVLLELKRSESGHLGVFPEQAANWDWVAAAVGAAPPREDGAATIARPLKVLNLFAYTGASTLAATAAGAEMTHVDAARNVVAWARRNAELSGLAEAAVRWIGEESMKFVRRELRREATYDAVILDPPSYGHGPRGEVWRLSQHLRRLLEMCGQLTAGRRRFVLLTCHTPNYDPGRLKRLLGETLSGGPSGCVVCGPMALQSRDGRQLPSGAFARWEPVGVCGREKTPDPSSSRIA